MNQKQWIMLAVSIIVLIIVWNKNRQLNVLDGEADVYKYSDGNAYKYISPMKHDIFKQMTIDLLPYLILSSMSTSEFISLNNFEQSALGKTLLAGFGYTLFYQFVQPYIVNRLPNF